MIVRGLSPDGKITDTTRIRHALTSYADLIYPWAQSVANYMLADVSRRNERAWHELGKEIGRSLRIELAQAPTGMVYSALLAENVGLITSLPRKAAERVHTLATEARLTGKRHEEVAKAILDTGRVTASRATLIARTETSRAACSLTQARAMFAGSEGYIWRTVEDEHVRPEHKKMDGKYVRWSHPPKTDPGLDPYHAGCGPNCRCYPDPVFPST